MGTYFYSPNSVYTDWSLGKVSLEPVSVSSVTDSAKSSNKLSQKNFDLIQLILNCFSGINFDKASTRNELSYLSSFYSLILVDAC